MALASRRLQYLFNIL